LIYLLWPKGGKVQVLSKNAKRFGGFTLVLLILGTSIFLAQPRIEAVDRQPTHNLPSQLGWVGSVRSAADIVGKQSRFKWLMKKIVGLDDRERAMLVPYGIAVDSRGRMLVVDTRARLVHVFDPENHKYKTFNAPRNDPFASPIAIALDGAGQIYVSDSVRSRIFIFNSDGKFLRTIGGLSKTESIFKRSTGIAIDRRRERLYVVDTVAMKVIVLGLDGKVIQRIGDRGLEPGKFNFPTQIAIAPDSSFWVVDSLNFRVQHFDPEGKVINGFGRLGDGLGEFDKAKGISLDSRGNLYIVDSYRDRVQVYTPEGHFLFFFGHTGPAEGQFYLPTGIAVDDRDRIYVADSYNRRVEIFQLRSDAKLSPATPGGL
jgi:DNA-binding beta-propeller fold protein YncE